MLKMIYKELHIGGAETLLLRVGSYFLKHGTQVALYCNCIKSQKMKEAFLDEGITVIENNKSVQIAFSNVEDDDIYLTLLLYDYIDCISEKNKYHFSNRVFYYVVHPYNSVHKTRLGPINIFLQSKYKSILETSIKAGTMFFMDEACVNCYIDYYGNTISKKQIVFLPMDIRPINQSEIKNRCENRKQSFNIMSVSRADFHFKGYLKGLIDVFTKIYKHNSKIHLTIISSGNDIALLRQWITDANNITGNRIRLLEDVKPLDLKQYYDDTSLYIGMGTTLLEACDYGIPALPIEAYTYELKCKGFFDRANGRISILPGEGNDAMPFIEEIINMSDDEYVELSINCRKIYESKHDISIIHQYLIDKKLSPQIDIPLIVSIECGIRNMLQRMRNL